MKIAIIGYGAMGHLIEDVAKERGIEVVSIIDPQAEGATHKEVSEESVKEADVCIDFTIPQVAVENIKKISASGKNIVMATTGWYDQMDDVKKIVEESDNGFIWSGNFSIGVNMFFRMVKAAAKVANKVEEYDIASYELHHNRKADSPSGTANMIGNILVDNIDRKSKLVFDKLDRKIEADELHISSVRGGDIPGTHTILFDSTADTIELKHTARTRKGFALGAVMAAEFINEKKGWFEIDDLMDNVIGGQ
jgi:4-hydroxy-tetrahydrodipicolinate reductase